MTTYYSRNQEGTLLETELIEVLDEMDYDGDLTPGAIYYVSQTRPVVATDILDEETIRAVLDVLDMKFAETFDDPVDFEFSSFTPDQIQALTTALAGWISSLPFLDRYYIWDGPATPHAVTEAEIADYKRRRPA